MPDKAVNPVHFKPMWMFARVGEEQDLDETMQALMLSDAEMLAIKVALSTLSKWADVPGADDMTIGAGRIADEVLEKLNVVLHIAFEEE